MLLPLSTLLLLPLGALSSRSLSYNGLATTPQLGWNTWNTFACNISQQLILDAAHALVDSGLKDAGYNYVLIDDCWQAPARDPKTSAPLADPERFPKGLGWLVDEIHGLGMKAGIYSSAGVYTCAGEFGTLGYEEIDAKAYAYWGFDYLKYDNCYNAGQYGTPDISYNRYKKMSDALLATGREIFYSLCSWGEDGVENWASIISNSWRMSGDIFDNFDEPTDDCPATRNSVDPPGYMCSVSNIVDKAVPLLQKSIRGSWADLDMLEVGGGKMSTDEYVVHFTLWAMMKSPLILGNDLTKMDATTLAILSNPAILAISQSTYGAARPARRISGRAGEVQVWLMQTGDEEYVVGLVNFSGEDQTVSYPLETIFKDQATLPSRTFTSTSLWSPPYVPSSFPTLSQPFGENELPQVVRDELKDVQLRRHAGRFWKLQVAKEGESRGGERDEL